MTIRLKIRKRKNTASNGSCDVLDLHEAGIGLLTGKESNHVRPNKNGKLAYLNSPKKDAKSRCSLNGLVGGDDIMMSTSSITRRHQKNDLSEKNNSLSADYKKMDDECNLTLDTGNCSVSLLSDPTLVETQRTGWRNNAGRSDIFMCFVPKFRNKSHDDVPLNPIPAKKMQTLTRHLVDTKNNPLFLSYEAASIGSRNNPEICALMLNSSHCSCRTPEMHSSKLKAENDVTSKAPNQKVSPFDRSSLAKTEPFLSTRDRGQKIRQDDLRIPLENLKTRSFEHQQQWQQHQKYEGLNPIPFQNDQIGDLFDMKSITKLSSSESQMDSESLKKTLQIPFSKIKVDGATFSYSLEDSGSSESSSSIDDDDDNEIHVMTEEEHERIIANIAELNKQFYARCESEKNEGLHSTRKQRVKWWDDDKTTFCGETASAFLNDDSAYISSSNSQFDIGDIFLYFLSCGQKKEEEKGPIFENTKVQQQRDDDDANIVEDYDEDHMGRSTTYFHEIDDCDEDTVDLTEGIDGFQDSRSLG